MRLTRAHRLSRLNCFEVNYLKLPADPRQDDEGPSRRARFSTRIRAPISTIFRNASLSRELESQIQTVSTEQREDGGRSAFMVVARTDTSLARKRAKMKTHDTASRVEPGRESLSHEGSTPPSNIRRATTRDKRIGLCLETTRMSLIMKKSNSNLRCQRSSRDSPISLSRAVSRRSESRVVARSGKCKIDTHR